ncbi:hypothetical protein R3P38DRAFT_3240712 [Favolaschia claudopus]|uniref:Uncharacterized protein n=1 Tax=Favolaschia claudopus TaxID=2862362 RepID=A0AAV9Z6I2_9AGAR
MDMLFTTPPSTAHPYINSRRIILRQTGATDQLQNVSPPSSTLFPLSHRPATTAPSAPARRRREPQYGLLHARLILSTRWMVGSDLGETHLRLQDRSGFEDRDGTDRTPHEELDEKTRWGPCRLIRYMHFRRPGGCPSLRVPIYAPHPSPSSSSAFTLTRLAVAAHCPRHTSPPAYPHWQLFIPSSRPYLPVVLLSISASTPDVEEESECG